MDETYPDWERFRPYVESTAGRLACDSDTRADLKQEMWLRLFTRWRKKPTASDSYLKQAMFRAALDFLRRVLHDGPHDDAGARQSERLTYLLDEE